MCWNSENERVNFGWMKNGMKYGDLLEVELKWLEEFLELDRGGEKGKNEGVYKVLGEKLGIGESGNKFVVELLEY